MGFTSNVFFHTHSLCGVSRPRTALVLPTPFGPGCWRERGCPPRSFFPARLCVLAGLVLGRSPTREIFPSAALLCVLSFSSACHPPRAFASLRTPREALARRAFSLRSFFSLCVPVNRKPKSAGCISSQTVQPTWSAPFTLVHSVAAIKRSGLLSTLQR